MNWLLWIKSKPVTVYLSKQLKAIVAKKSHCSSSTAKYRGSQLTQGRVGWWVFDAQECLEAFISCNFKNIKVK